MAQVRNVTTGAKGIWDRSGVLVMVEGGETADVDADASEIVADWFESDDVADEPAEPGPLDLSVADLEAHVATMGSADELQALIDAETAGKSRKGALAVLEARRDAILAA